MPELTCREDGQRLAADACRAPDNVDPTRTTMKLLLKSLAALLVATQVSAQSGLPTRAFTGITLFDGTGRTPPIQDAVIVVRNGRIVAAGPAKTTTVPRGAEVLVLDGTFVM